MSDFVTTVHLLDRVMQSRGIDELNLGGVKVERDFSGGLIVNVGEASYTMDRVPVEVFGQLSAAIERYNDLSTDGGIRE
jgi:hypothetical protein